MSHVIVVGPSGVGKSYLLQKAFCDSHIATGAEIVQRFTTRLPRTRESLESENKFTSVARFKHLRESGRIVVAWPKENRPGVTTWYGFQGPLNISKRKLVFPGNEQLLREEAIVILSSMLVNVVVVLVDADDDTRHRRIALREPAMDADEFQQRLKRVPRDEYRLAPHIILRNDATTEHVADSLFTHIVLGALACSGRGL